MNARMRVQQADQEGATTTMLAQDYKLTKSIPVRVKGKD